jgi:hypothetical protein
MLKNLARFVALASLVTIASAGFASQGGTAPHPNSASVFASQGGTAPHPPQGSSGR